MFLFLIFLVVGFAFAGASAFTTTYSQWWGERGGRIATSILRNFLGIPLWLFGFALAWLQAAPVLFLPTTATKILAWLLLGIGAVPVVWGHLVLGWRTHMPSVRDTLVRHGLYAYVRHPIYSGGILMLVGVAALEPTLTVALACAVAIVFFVVQAFLEEIDLLQRLPRYREYMREVPRFIPRLRTQKPDVARRSRKLTKKYA